MLEVEMSGKGDGVPVEGKCRWRMRNSDGTVWETSGYYLPEEVDQWECSKPVEPVTTRDVGKTDDLIQRLRERARIRRQIHTRKSVQEGKPDRIADLLDEAATKITNLRERLEKAQTIAWDWGQGVTDAETAIRQLHALFPIEGDSHE